MDRQSVSVQDSSQESIVQDLQVRRLITGILRQNPKVLNLPFKEDMGRADRDNAIDLYIGDEYMDILADGAWERVFTEKPSVFTKEEKKAWLAGNTDVYTWFRCILPI